MAASAAYDANIDTAVLLGWSYVERVAFQAFSEELQTAPAAAQGALGKLATFYGLTRVERGLAFFLASGAAEKYHLTWRDLCIWEDGGPSTACVLSRVKLAYPSFS